LKKSRERLLACVVTCTSHSSHQCEQTGVS